MLAALYLRCKTNIGLEEAGHDSRVGRVPKIEKNGRLKQGLWNYNTTREQVIGLSK